jgi:glycosyltransferase involved in cell wall biosynthesis
MPLAISSANPRRVMVTTDAVGGVWRYTLELTRTLSEAGITVAVVVLGPKPQARQLDEAYRSGSSVVEVTGLPLDWTVETERELNETARILRRHAGDWRADLVHLNAPAYVGFEPWPCPVVATVHSCVGTWWAGVGRGTMPKDLAWRAARTALGMEAADAVIAPSASFASALRGLYGPEIAVTAVHNGRSRPRRSSKKRVPSDIVLTAGRLWDRGKNIRLVDAAARLSRVQVFAAGAVSGPNGDHVDLPHLELLGSLDEPQMRAWQARAGIFVSPSLYEPFGLAVLEAAHAGTALVLSDIPTFRELWDGAALFVDPHDAQGLGEMLRSLRRNPSERSRLATAAALRAARYTSSGMGQKTLEMYRHALAARTQPLLAGGLGA